MRERETVAQVQTSGILENLSPRVRLRVLASGPRDGAKAVGGEGAEGVASWLRVVCGESRVQSGCVVNQPRAMGWEAIGVCVAER